MHTRIGRGKRFSGSAPSHRSERHEGRVFGHGPPRRIVVRETTTTWRQVTAFWRIAICSTWPVDVGAVLDADHVDNPCIGMDTVDESVSATTG